jgi:hypothetical protein
MQGAKVVGLFVVTSVEHPGCITLLESSSHSSGSLR